MSKILFLLFTLLLITNCGGGGESPTASTDTPSCTGFDCGSLKYNLFVADIDFSQASPEATNIQIVESNSFQNMTHPRISPNKQWVAYTRYNMTNSEGCATIELDPSIAYVNTEIRSTRLDDGVSKTILAMTNGELTSNNYWYNNNYEFTFLSGAPLGGARLYRAQTNASMELIAGPTEITIPSTITPFDPQAISATQLVYGGVYDLSGVKVKSIFIQSLNPPGLPTGLSLGRDNTGLVKVATEVLENDPKISPDGVSVSFMRSVPNGGVDGFGFRIFVVPVADPLNEVNISASLGASILNNDALPEWIDNTTLVFTNIDSTTTFNTRTIWTMKSDGSERKQVVLPSGYRYSDVFPYLDSSGNQKIIISAEKINATCLS